MQKLPHLNPAEEKEATPSWLSDLPRMGVRPLQSPAPSVKKPWLPEISNISDTPLEWLHHKVALKNYLPTGFDYPFDQVRGFSCSVAPYGMGHMGRFRGAYEKGNRVNPTNALKWYRMMLYSFFKGKFDFLPHLGVFNLLDGTGGEANCIWLADHSPHMKLFAKVKSSHNPWNVLLYGIFRDEIQSN